MALVRKEEVKDMGIETTGQIFSGARVGSANRGTVTIEPGFSSSFISSLYSGEGLYPLSTIVNEGSVALGILENTMPVPMNKFNLNGEIIFNPFKRQSTEIQANSGALIEADPAVPEVDLSPEEAVVEAVLITSQVKPGFVEKASINERAQGVAEVEPVNPWLKSEVVNEPEILATPVVYQEEVVKVEMKKARKEDEGLEEVEIEQEEIKYVLDESAYAQRIFEFEKAIDQLGDEFNGREVIDLLPGESDSNRSQALKELDPNKQISDGSLAETREEFALGKYKSKKEAKDRVHALVSEKEPAKKDKQGRGLKFGALARVYKYRPLRIPPQEQVITRVIKKNRIQAGMALKESEVSSPVVVKGSLGNSKKELKIEDNPVLAELFQRVDTASTVRLE